MLRPAVGPLLPAFLACSLLVQAAQPVTSPKQQFGFDVGEDYQLANYKQLVAYWKKLEHESQRLKVVDIGTTEEGRTMVMGVISSPDNIKKVERYRDVARHLAQVDGLDDTAARKLAAEGKVIVWISGGLHASETLGSQQLIETVYQLVNGTDAETARILDNVIVLAVPANPDGIDFISDWYMRSPDPKARQVADYPHLYQKYAGHDNNRDFYAATQSETKAMLRVMFKDWFPQVVYDHHQAGPPGTVMFAPPFRDPFNYVIDPRVISGIDAFGAAMMNRFLAEGKPGVTVRSGMRYSTWYNGGLRSVGYYHNVIALLTETIGSPTPMNIPFDPALQLPHGDLLSPVEPQPWHMRQSVEYSLTASRAVLDQAARQRFELLWGIYAMGRDAIAKGSRDTWTVTPDRVAKAKEALAKEPKGRKDQAAFQRTFRRLEDRDARGYILPSDQPDFLTATRFINTLMENAVKVHRATEAFEAGGRRYPAGSYVVLCNQPYRAHVIDMFEPQHHPDDVAYPGGPPIPPYDLAGWTLALQMNVKFDRLLEGFTGQFQELKALQPPPPGKVTKGAAGHAFSTRQNDAFKVLNDLQAAGMHVSRLRHELGSLPAGSFFVPNEGDIGTRLEKLAQETGVNFEGLDVAPGEAAALKPVRVGLWDEYGGSKPSGWTRWVLEHFDFPFKVVYVPELDAGNLREKFDVLVFVTGAIPAMKEVKGSTTPAPAPPARIPEEYRAHYGSISAARTLPALRAFLEAGGTVLTLGSSTNLAADLGLPVASQIADAGGKPLLREKFYIPGSLMRARVDTTHPLAWGMENQADFMFELSPVFRPPPAEAAAVVKAVAWYDEAEPLRSGWAVGQPLLKGGLAVAEAHVGAGHLILCGPEIAYRAQPHGTFKFLFNGIVNAGMAEAVP